MSVEEELGVSHPPTVMTIQTTDSPRNSYTCVGQVMVLREGLKGSKIKLSNFRSHLVDDHELHSDYDGYSHLRGDAEVLAAVAQHPFEPSLERDAHPGCS